MATPETPKYQRPPAKATGDESVVMRMSSSPELGLSLWYWKSETVGTGRRSRELRIKSPLAPRVRTLKAETSSGRVT